MQQNLRAERKQIFLWLVTQSLRWGGMRDEPKERLRRRQIIVFLKEKDSQRDTRHAIGVTIPTTVSFKVDLFIWLI